ncbi:RNA-binding protein cabeza-like [Helianthus annuus]|uniref:RNA-binding protein cabeza-like n=1 Tax=Helianthus annuus TaxID=4232 RepID=UPI000B9061C7|nr:RNA-binding protein cabeza-like [Helianthus annuus]
MGSGVVTKPEDLKRFQGTQGKSASAEIVSGIPSWIHRKSPQVPEVGSKEKPNGVKTSSGVVGGNSGGGGAKENGGGGGVKRNVKEGGNGGGNGGGGNGGGGNGGGE